MNSTMMLQQAFDLNTQGICSLANGKAGRNTIVAIKQAMQAMDALYDDEVASEVNTNTSATQEVKQDGSLRCRAVSIPELKDDQFFIFNYAFMFAPAATDASSSGSKMGPTDMAFGCATLTFNMALTYHQLGMQSGSTRKLRTACLLYGKVVEMASAAVESLPSTDVNGVGSDLFSLHLVALNNAAQIQYCLANFPACDELQTHVKHMIQQLFEHPESYSERLMEILPGGALEEIKLNTVVCSMPSTAPTA